MESNVSRAYLRATLDESPQGQTILCYWSLSYKLIKVGVKQLWGVFKNT